MLLIEIGYNRRKNSIFVTFSLDMEAKLYYCMYSSFEKK